MPSAAAGSSEPAGDTEPASGEGEDCDAGAHTAGPVRTCAVTRQAHPIDELVRFVAGPGGEIVPDLARRLPGRGVWVSLSRTSLQHAVARNVFAKSLKRAVTADAALPERVETLLTKRVVDSLALANKAGLAVAGYSQVDEAIEGTDFAGLFHGLDGAPQGREKLDRKLRAVAEARQIEPQIIEELTIDQMSLALGRPNVVHALLISGGATARLLDEVKRLRRLRTSPH